jgi:hypothetical protein
MQLIEDNTLIFNFLEQNAQLPVSYNKDAVYSFVKDNSFFMVIYTCSGNEKRFRLFRIGQFAVNSHELNDILLWLQDEMETCKAEILERAVDEVNRIIGTSGTGALFYDAH